MPRIALVSYATERFQSVRQELNESAARFGISDILSFGDDDLHGSDYYLRNKSILDEVCGAGYWAWKPYFILQAMQRLDENDVLFYCDAGSLFVSSPEPLVELCRCSGNGMVLFDARPLRNLQFTKRDCFVRMDCDDPEYWNANKVIATVLVLRKCAFAVAFISEWLGYCNDRAVITDDANICGRDNLPGFLQHRNDQAILSVLAKKHELETFRNPTLWGNFLKLPEFRIRGEPVLSPFNLVPEISGYALEPQINSPYGTIFEINRLPNWVGKPAWPPTQAARLSFAGKFLRWTRKRPSK